MKKHEPDTKKKARMFEIINQVMEYAADEDRNLIRKVYGREPKRNSIKIWSYLSLCRPMNLRCLQILFLFETGLRTGECCGLKWSDINNRRLYIQRQANNEGVKEWTKSMAVYRGISLTTQALRLLEEVNSFNVEHGYTAEWIFQSNNVRYDCRLSYNAADRKSRKLCARLDSVMKSPHKCQITYISTLLDNPNVNNKTVQRFAGHTDFTATNT